LHTRFGVTDPAVFKTLATSALGLEKFTVPSSRYTSLAYVQQAPLPDESASMDFTREFTRDVDGNIVAAVFLDIAT
jgi:hypothetical protein